jgi:hypothetical protein
MIGVLIGTFALVALALVLAAYGLTQAAEAAAVLDDEARRAA